MSAVVALNVVRRDAAILPKSGVNRKFPAHAQYDAVDPKAASAAGLFEASVPYRLVMEPFEFVSQMQNAALEVSYHQVIRRRAGQSLSGLLFEGFLPPFKISNMIRFRHGSLRIHAPGSKKEERARCGNVA